MGKLPAISILDTHLGDQALIHVHPCGCTLHSTFHLSISFHQQRSTCRDCPAAKTRGRHGCPVCLHLPDDWDPDCASPWSRGHRLGAPSGWRLSVLTAPLPACGFMCFSFFLSVDSSEADMYVLDCKCRPDCQP